MKMKKTITCALILGTLVTATPAIANNNAFAATKKTQVTFTDKDAKNWIKSYVKLVFSKPSNIIKNSKNYKKSSNKGISFINSLPTK